MNTFKFRAECQHDVMKFLQEIGGNYKMIKLERHYEYIPDIEVEIMTSIGMSELRSAISMVQDGHVMHQTLSLKEEYTGERRY